MGADPISWAERFAAALVVGGERVPFERVLAHHLDDVTELRASSGLTWRSMASLLARAGARRADGGLISADQLRVGYARLTRNLEKQSRRPVAVKGESPQAPASGLAEPAAEDYEAEPAPPPKPEE